MKIKYFNKNDLIFYEGDEPEYFYGIIQGSVSVRNKCITHIAYETCADGQETQIEALPGQLNCTFRKTENGYVKEYELIKLILEEGNCFGEKALLFNNKRANSVYAEELCCLFYLNRKNFNNLFKVSQSILYS